MRGDHKRPLTPGPGQYNIKQKVGNEGPKITLSNYRPLSSSTAHANGIPGPGQYNPNMNNRNRSPTYRIGSSKRDGIYKHLEKNPGPGQYTPSHTQRPKSPSWRMGTSTRRPLTPTEAHLPGPGNYNYKTTVGEGPKVILS